jgi:hypothetical protein
MCGLIRKRNHTSRCVDTYEIKTYVSSIHRNDHSSTIFFSRKRQISSQGKIYKQGTTRTNIRRLSPQEVPKRSPSQYNCVYLSFTSYGQNDNDYVWSKHVVDMWTKCFVLFDWFVLHLWLFRNTKWMNCLKVTRFWTETLEVFPEINLLLISSRMQLRFVSAFP